MVVDYKICVIHQQNPVEPPHGPLQGAPWFPQNLSSRTLGQYQLP